MPTDSAIQHLYVHVPFCDGKCDYCGFYSVVAHDAARQAYAPLPGRELRAMLDKGTVSQTAAPRTLYIGGGTPGMLADHGLRRLVEGLREAVNLEDVEEWTVELNPATVTPALADTLAILGVNRVSLGAQCFDDDVLRSLGRRHDVKAIVRAMDVLTEAGFQNTGLDLIAGLPGLTTQGWRVSIERALALRVVHLSIYALSLEPDTVLARRVAGGESLPDDEAQLEALSQAETLLAGAGLVRYEISNYARPGWECRHNLACWRGEDYLGLGPAAASRADSRRWTNLADLAGYVGAVTADTAPPRDAETLDASTDATERFVFGLRLYEGVRPDIFAERWPAATSRVGEWHETLTRLGAQGLVEQASHGGWRLTARGRQVADAVMRELV
ncbi:MAG: radical SAM family heme chaperone HemW [Phycisphaerae bacterium]|nr:radical SAM family heme chaperone HemW [Phycisphaerae bacterium]